MRVKRSRLIQEVRKRPLLWDLKTSTPDRSRAQCAALWKDVGKVLNSDGPTCKRVWKTMRSQFWNEVSRITMRIEKAKKKGEHDPSTKYYCWPHFDSMRFVLKGRFKGAKRLRHFENSSENNIVANNITAGGNTFETNNDNDINLDHTRTESLTYFENRYECNTDLEIVENGNPTQHGRENSFENNLLLLENNASPTILVQGFDESNAESAKFLSYNISIPNCVEGNEKLAIINDEITLQNDEEFISEDPKSQVDTETDSSQNETTFNEFQEDSSASISADELCDDSEDSVLLAESNVNERNKSSVTEEDYFSSSYDLNDENYSFLYSFLAQTTGMTQWQKIEFRAHMKNLLLQISPDSILVSILEKQLLLSEDNDTDRKFLLSFCPFMKSLSSRQNLQFRAKMSDLVLQILSKKIL